MLRYVIQTGELYEVLGVLYDVLEIAVSFYDIDFQELAFLDKTKQAAYCGYRRRNATFFQECKKCDRHYFDLARQTGKIQVYLCHANLLDGIVPLHDDHGKFLGGIVFGQARLVGQVNPHPPGSQLGKHHEKLPVASLERMEQIGRLLQLLTETIVRHRMVAFRSLDWTEKLERYIEMHMNQRITLQDLAQLVDRSPSFISHHFKRELGKSPAVYINEKRMEVARQLLESGEQVKHVADLLGFYDAFHFSKVFKKHFGRPPLAFRASAGPASTSLNQPKRKT
jgi:AraC-like DNA-binding protein/ligand-binding sensor protein